MNKDYLKQVRRDVQLYDAFVTPNTQLGTYDTQVNTPTVESGQYMAENIDWTKDAFTDWSVKRNTVNADTQRGKAIVLNKELDDISKASDYANALVNKQMLTQQLQQATAENKPTQGILSEYTKTLTLLGSKDYFDAYQNTINSNKLTGADIPQQLEWLGGKTEELLDQQTEYIKKAEEYEANAKYWEDKHRISDSFKYKASKPGFDFTDIDTYLYKTPGLLGSSASSMLSQAAGMVAGTVTAAATTAAAAAITAGTGGVAAPAAVALLGAGATVAANIFSRSEESYAEVYQHYKDNVKNKATKDKTLDKSIANAKKQLADQGVDPSLLEDDKILDLILTGKVKSGNIAFDKSKIDATEGLASLYSDNMALSALDVAQTAIMVMPYGQLAKAANGIGSLGKTVTGINKARKYIQGIPEAIGKRVDEVAAYGLENASRALVTKTVSKGIREVGGKIMLTSALEGMEEGTQYIKGKEYLEGKFDANPNIAKSWFTNLGTQARSLYAAITPFDPVYSTDSEFLENFKGGALLGGLMTSGMVAIQEGATKISKGTTHYGRQINADKFVSALFTENFADKDMLDKNMAYTKAVRTSSKQNIDDAFDNMSELNINGVDKESILKEKERANRVMAQAESEKNKKMAKLNGIDPRTEDYDIFVGLQEYHRDRYKESLTERDKSYRDTSQAINNADWSSITLPDDKSLQEYQTAAIAVATDNMLDEAISTQKSILDSPAQGVDIQNVQEVLRQLIKTKQKNAEVANIVIQGFDLSEVKDNPIDRRVLDALSKQMWVEIDNDINLSHYKQISGVWSKAGTKSTVAKTLVDKYKAKVIRETEQTQRLQDQSMSVPKQVKQTEVTPVSVTTVPAVPVITTVEEAKPAEVKSVESKPIEAKPVAPVNNPTVSTAPVAQAVDERAEPEEIVKLRSKTTESVNAVKANQSMIEATNVLKMMYGQVLSELPNYDSSKVYAEYKVKSAIDEFELIDNTSTISDWDQLKSYKDNLEDAILDGDSKSQSKYEKLISIKLSELKTKAEKESEVKQTDIAQKQVVSNIEAAEVSKPTAFVEQVTPIVEKQTVPEPTLQIEPQSDEATTDEPIVTKEQEQQQLQELTYDKYADPYSHELNYWVSRKTNEPFQGYEEFERSNTFSEVSTESTFLPDSDVQLVVRDYTDKKGNVSKAIYAEFTYKGNKYVAAIADPMSLRNYLSRGRGSEQVQHVIDNLNALRDKVIELSKHLKPGQRIVPTALEKTTGRIKNAKNEDGSPKNQNLLKLTGYVPSDPYSIDHTTVQIGISTGNRSNRVIRCGRAYFNGVGTTLGQAYLLIEDKPVQLNTRKFTDDKDIATVIYDMLIADPIENYTTKDGVRTPFKPDALIKLLVNFGSQTGVRQDDYRLSKDQITALQRKQFYMTEDKLFLGTKVYQMSDLVGNPNIREEIIQYITDNLHWNVDEDALHQWWLGSNITSKENPFFYLKMWFESNKVDKLVVIPGKLEFNIKDAGLKLESGKVVEDTSAPNGLSMLGWYIRQGVLLSDFVGFEDANIYIKDVKVENISEAKHLEKAVETAVKAKEIPTEQIKAPVVKLPSIGDAFAELGPLNKEVPQSSDAQINTESAKQWLITTLGLTDDQVDITDNVIEVLQSGMKVVGRANLDSIQLSKLAPEGTQYHEAWHRVSNLLISNTKRKAIYDRFRKKSNTKLSDRQIDEMLADEYMEFQLGTKHIDYQTNNWFKKISNFIKIWSKVGNYRMSKLYYDINVGKYSNVKSNSENIARFKKLYSTGLNFTIKGHEFNTITNTSVYNNILDSLTYLFFFYNNIHEYNDISKLDKDHDGMDRLRWQLYAWTQSSPDNATIAEIYDNYDNVFIPALASRLKVYNTTMFEKLANDEFSDIDAGEVDGVNIGEHTIASYEMSKRDNAPAEVKFFFQSIPQWVFNSEGKKVVETEPSTGFSKFVDPRKAWNTVLNDLHDIRDISDMKARVDKFAETNLFYAAVSRKLQILLDKQNSSDKEISAAAETTLTKLENTIQSHKHNFITGNISRNDNGLIEVTIKDNMVDTKAVQYPKIWSTSLFYNIGNTGIFQQKDDGSVDITPNGKQVFQKFITNLEIIRRAFIQNKGILKLKHGNFDIHEEANQNKVKQLLVEMLNSVGILIDVDTLDEMFKAGEFGDFNRLTPYQTLNNMILDTNSSVFGGIQSIANVLNDVLNQVKFAKSDNLMLLHQFTRDNEIKEVRPVEIWNTRGFVKLLANYYAKTHVNTDELRSLGADGNSLYSIAQNNFASDQINRLNRDTEYVSKLNSVVFNQGSLLLSSIKSSESKLRLETFVNFKDTTSFDTGRDYFQITDREDYIAKMAMIFNDRILFPTVADKKTYHVISGVVLPHERVQFKTVGTTQQVTYGDQSMAQFMKYFYAEVAAIELCMQQIDDTLDENGNHNKHWVEPSRRVANYHTGNDKYGPNGVHFRLFTGLHYMSEGKEKFINFNDPNKTPQQNLDTAKNWLASDRIPDSVKYSMVSSTLSKTVGKEIRKAKELGLIDGNSKTDIYSLTNVLLDQKQLNLRKLTYMKSTDSVIRNNAEGYAIYDMIADYTINSIISIVEVEKLFSGDPAYYKYKWSDNGIIDMSIDKIKRLGALTSTGLNNRLDFDNRFIRPTYNVAELNDYEVKSPQFDVLQEQFINGNIYDFIRVYHGDNAIYNEDGSYKSIDDLKADPKNKEAIDAATLQSKKEVAGYKSGINVADAAVYVSPEMYHDMMRMIGQWSTDVEEAFRILTDPASSRLWESDPTLYVKVLKTSLKPLKYMAFGQRLSEIPGLGIPYFNKMAIFPLFEAIATGDMKPLYDRMTNPENKLDMVMFNSAVKAGSVGAMGYYDKAIKLGHNQDVLSAEQTDDLNQGNVSYTGNKVADLNTLQVYTQEFDNLRQQLNTDPHTHEEQMAGTQMLKVGLSNIHENDLYGKDKHKGSHIRQEVFKTMNALSDIGASRIREELFDEYNEVNRKELYAQLQKDAIDSDANDNIVSGLATDEYGKPTIPLAACSDNSFVESRFISDINGKTIDINLPGGSFIQRSTFGLEATSQSVISDDMLNDGKRLKLVNDDGSMDSIVSINLFKHIIPGYKNMTFAETKIWLIKHNIIGENSTATAIGYRIPTQAIASVSALRFTDVLPEIMGDTIVLPEEFTKLTGSDKH